MSGRFTHVNLGEVEDQAPKFGYGELGEARFARGALDAAATGVSLQRLRPGIRQAFAHRHQSAEEVYVVLSGSGRIRVDDEVVELRPLDAIRIARIRAGGARARGVEAGPDGLEHVGAFRRGAHENGARRGARSLAGAPPSLDVQAGPAAQHARSRPTKYRVR